ncbi:MAG: hypothetical protein ACRKFN_02675 [Desulfitobacterium sp.]
MSIICGFRLVENVHRTLSTPNLWVIPEVAAPARPCARGIRTSMSKQPVTPLMLRKRRPHVLPSALKKAWLMASEARQKP